MNAKVSGEAIGLAKLAMGYSKLHSETHRVNILQLNQRKHAEVERHSVAEPDQLAARLNFCFPAMTYRGLPRSRVEADLCFRRVAAYPLHAICAPDDG
jgi:hypothetical protein